MLSMSETVKEILRDSSKAADLTGEFEVPLTERYRRFLISFTEVQEENQPGKFRAALAVLEVGLGALGAALGFFLILAGASDAVKLTAWISYIVLVVVVGFTIRIIPTDVYQFYLEASKIRLVNLSERLAAEVALFSLIAQQIVEDDLSVISKLSERVPEIESLGRDIQAKIRNCQDSSKVFDDPRETNIVIRELKISREVADQLRAALRQIIELCGHLFAGRDYSAKLYLRAVKSFGGGSVEMLVPFAKYPSDIDSPTGFFGSSWIKARGNPSIVWDSIEKGQAIHAKRKRFSSFAAYYSTVLAIPLPGRIGVLALTSNQENAFDKKDDQWVIRALALPTRTIVLKLLGINE